MSNLLRHGQIPSLHHSPLKTAASNEGRDSELMDPSFVRGKDLHGLLSVSPTYLSFLVRDTCTCRPEGSGSIDWIIRVPGILRNVPGNWLNLWVKRAKKDMLPKVLSFSLFWEDSEYTTASCLENFLPPNFFLYCSGKSYWIHVLSLICAFSPCLQSCFIYKINQNKTTALPPALSRSQLYTSEVSCYTGFFWEDGGAEDTQLSVEQAVWRREWHSWVTLCIVPYHVAEGFMQAFIQIVGK